MTLTKSVGIAIALFGLMAGCGGPEGDPGPLGSLKQASGGGSGGAKVDTIKVSKNFWVASNNTLLINASSSDFAAHLFLYKTSDNQYYGEVQNGGGGRYGGTVFYSATDPVMLTINSSSGGNNTFPTAPYQP